MEDKSCPFCGSPRFRLEDGMLRVCAMPIDAGEPDEEGSCLVYRCLLCGRAFDEIEAQEGTEADRDGRP